LMCGEMLLNMQRDLKTLSMIHSIAQGTSVFSDTQQQQQQHSLVSQASWGRLNNSHRT
jgi:hypothetical protein